MIAGVTANYSKSSKCWGWYITVYPVIIAILYFSLSLQSLLRCEYAWGKEKIITYTHFFCKLHDNREEGFAVCNDGCTRHFWCIFAWNDKDFHFVYILFLLTFVFTMSLSYALNTLCITPNKSWLFKECIKFWCMLYDIT